MRTLSPIAVSLLAPNGEQFPATVRLSQGSQEWDRALDFASEQLGEHHFNEGDYFKCLISLRRMLEERGWRILCNGARPNVWPSGMARSMAGGAAAYLYPAARRKLGPDDLVDIFGEASPEQIVGVDDHLENFRNYPSILRGRAWPADRPRARTE